MTADFSMIFVARSGAEARRLAVPWHVVRAWCDELPAHIGERAVDVGAPILTKVRLASFAEARAATEAVRETILMKSEPSNEIRARLDRQVLAYCDEIAGHLTWSGGVEHWTSWVLLTSTDID